MLQPTTTISVDYKILYEATLQKLEAAQLELQQLKLRMAQFEKMIFGSRHERFVPDNGTVTQQLALALQAEAIGERTVTKEEVTITRTNIQVEKKPHPGRMALPADLPRQVVTIEPEGDTTNLTKIGEEITEQLARFVAFGLLEAVPFLCVYVAYSLHSVYEKLT